MGWASCDEQHFIATPLEFIGYAPEGDAESIICKLLSDEIKMRRKLAVECEQRKYAYLASNLQHFLNGLEMKLCRQTDTPKIFNGRNFIPGVVIVVPAECIKNNKKI